MKKEQLLALVEFSDLLGLANTYSQCLKNSSAFSQALAIIRDSNEILAKELIFAELCECWDEEDVINELLLKIEEN